MKIDHINFERTGGFAGIRIAADIEVDDLPDEQKEQLLELLDEVDFEELPKRLAGEMPIPDGFVYSISVESGKKEYSLMAGESALPEDLHPLIELLERIAKKQMRSRK